jgi:Ca-activated chloride channel homolog
MAKRLIVVVALLALPFCGHGPRASAQDGQAIQVNVVLVQLSVAVTDNKGNYVSGLKPEDFAIYEDKIPEKAATFEEGGGPARTVALQPVTDDRPFAGAAGATENTADLSRLSSANVFVLFDTSNYMYRGFVYAQDAIADFIRSLEDVSKVALYSYSRDLSRVVTLTPDRSQVLHGLRSTVAGDDAALYNSLLLTVKDAAPLTGRKVVVVFSNGPDNASLVPPEDIAELAQSTGTIIYMISTKEAQAEPISTAVFQRMSTATGGKAYFSKDWRDEKKAFESIRDDLGHLYALSYYPAPNPNRGWRTITVKLVGKDLQKYHLRTRTGYRLLLTQTAPPLQESKVEAH